MPGSRSKRIHDHSINIGADYSDEELVWMNALHARKLELQRSMLTAGQILEVAHALGYRKVEQPCPVSQ